MQKNKEAILRRARKTVGLMGLKWTILRHQKPAKARKADALIKFQYPGGEGTFVVEVEARPTQPTTAALIQAKDNDLPALLVADYVNPKLAERLRENGVNFVDVAGNAYLQHDGLYVWVTGQRDTMRLETERERRRAYKPSGLKLLFTLLCRPKLAETDYRTLANQVGVALGTVQWVMGDLIKDKYVLRLGRFKRRLVEPKRLLDAWAPAYARDLRPRLLLGRFEAPGLNWWKGTDLAKHGALWGAEPAAALLTKQLKPGALTIYADKIPPRLVAEKRLKNNKTGRIEFRKKFWLFDTPETTLGAVPPVLVYADLLALEEPRAHQTAERVYEQLIDGPFRKHLAHRPR
jgi:hypothetical protein